MAAAAPEHATRKKWRPPTRKSKFSIAYIGRISKNCGLCFSTKKGEKVDNGNGPDVYFIFAGKMTAENRRGAGAGGKLILKARGCVWRYGVKA